MRDATGHSRSRQAAIIGLYLVLFAASDTLAFLFEVAPGVGTWYPSAGWNLALAFLLGWTAVPVLFLALLGSGLFIMEPGLPLPVLLAPDAWIALCYGAAGAWLQRTAPGADLLSVRGVQWLCLVAVVLPVLAGGGAIAGYFAAGVPGYTAATLNETFVHWWLGDAAAILTFMPLAVLGAAATLWRPTRRVRLRVPSLRATVFGIAEAAALGVGIYLAFFSVATGRFVLFWCVLPMLWIAVRHGLMHTIAALCVLNTSAALVLHYQQAIDQMMSVQLFMVAVSGTMLILGAVISERTRASRALRRAVDALRQRVSPSFAPDVERHKSTVIREAERLVALNEQVMEAGQALQEANVEKDRLLSVLSHDLKNPLIGISGLTEVLIDDDMPRDDELRTLSLMHQSSQQALALIDNLLAWARLQTGPLQLTPEVLNMRSVATRTIGLLESQASTKQLTLTNRIAADVRVRGDQFVVSTILRNILSNAVKYTPPGGDILLTAESTEACVRICVEDTGVGIAPKRLEALTTATERAPAYASARGTSGEHGTGLGLALCHLLAERAGGTVDIESTPGVGTTVTIALPRS